MENIIIKKTLYKKRVFGSQSKVYNKIYNNMIINNLAITKITIVQIQIKVKIDIIYREKVHKQKTEKNKQILKHRYHKYILYYLSYH